MGASNTYFERLGFQSQTFSSSGTFNVPEGINLVFIELWGGGGGGAETTSAGQTANGGQAPVVYVGQAEVTPGGSVSVTIGAGGSGASGGGNGADGADSVFEDITSRGGNGGILVSDSPIAAFDGADSFRALGGTGDFFGSSASNGGDAGHGAGGNGDGAGAGANGGVGAGGGGGSTAGGDGGVGRCIVHWRIT